MKSRYPKLLIPLAAAAAFLTLIGSLPRPAKAQTGFVTDGLIESTQRGFKFPDGTMQMSAVTQVSPVANVIRVGTSGGDFNSIGAALASITDNGPDNRYQILVGPGEYSGIVSMKEYVDIVGSGRNLTRLTHNGGSSNQVVSTANNVELRDLTVENDGSGTSLFALGVLSSGTAPLITNVDVLAHGSDFNYAVYNDQSAHPTLRHVRSTATGGSSAVAMYQFNANSTSHQSSFSGTDDTNGNGIYSTHGGSTNWLVTLTDSTVEASHKLFRISSVYTFVVAGSKVFGGGAVDLLSGSLSCVYCYDDSGATLDDLCETPGAPLSFTGTASRLESPVLPSSD